jgi:hypothetical protein
MICPKYKIDQYDYDEGGYAQFYYIKHHNSIGFKEFKNKQHAHKAWSIQKRLAKFDLAPKVQSNLCKLNFSGTTLTTNWGYITEKAFGLKGNRLKLIQDLVDKIQEQTNLKFWDCHWENVGYVIRGGKKKLVCIDTGKETWDGYANYFGYADPGPKCSYCLKYKCKCTGD